MKAFVKVNVSIHLMDDSVGTDPKESVRLNEEIRYPLAVNHAGVRDVADKAEAERVIDALGNHVKSMFSMMGVQQHTGTHVPKLEAAHGGDPESKNGLS